MKTGLLTGLATSFFFCLANAKVYNTKVAILGGGVSGMSAALKLTEEGIHDFIMIEARHELGGKVDMKMALDKDIKTTIGRAQNAKFGDINVELGCNWVQGLGTNPVNELAKKYKLHTVPTDGDDVLFYDEHGKVNGTEAYKKFNNYYDEMSDNASKF